MEPNKRSSASRKNWKSGIIYYYGSEDIKTIKIFRKIDDGKGDEISAESFHMFDKTVSTTENMYRIILDCFSLTPPSSTGYGFLVESDMPQKVILRIEWDGGETTISYGN